MIKFFSEKTVIGRNVDGAGDRAEKVWFSAQFVGFFRMILIDNRGSDMLSYKMMEITASFAAVSFLLHQNSEETLCLIRYPIVAPDPPAAGCRLWQCC